MCEYGETPMTKTVRDEALELLKRCDVAMRNYFSSDFDGGESFSILTADIPEFFKRAAVEPEKQP